MQWYHHLEGVWGSILPETLPQRWPTVPETPTPPVLTPLIPADAIARRVAELAAELDAAYAKTDRLILVGVMKGAWVFLADLMRQLQRPCEVSYVRLASYGDGTRSSGQVTVSLEGLPADVTGAHLLVVEVIVDSGLSLLTLRQSLADLAPASLRVMTLLDKPTARRVEVAPPDWVGFMLPAEAFVVGYGLDFAEQYRHLPYLGRLTVADDAAETSPEPASAITDG